MDHIRRTLGRMLRIGLLGDHSTQDLGINEYCCRDGSVANRGVRKRRQQQNMTGSIISTHRPVDLDNDGTP
jgi:hypothetical protein